MWAIRCVHEAQSHELNCFVTLTYADDKIPPGGTLVKKHFQDFMKRLRKLHKLPVRYFHCGEYGETTLRPHYHAILFGIDFADKKLHSKNAQGQTLWTSETLTKLWGFGHCLIGALTFETAAYTARYCLKKINGQLADAHYQGREPEYATMSRRPGIGADWFAKYSDDVYPSDFIVLRGQKQQPPRYYDKILKKENDVVHLGIKQTRITKALKNKANNTPARLAVRKEVQEAKLKSLKRSI